jgi:hypothetical protein
VAGCMVFLTGAWLFGQARRQHREYQRYREKYPEFDPT